MKGDELERELARGKGIFSAIIRETLDFLERFDSLGPVEIRAFEQRRGRLLDDLLAFQAELSDRIGEVKKAPTPAMANRLEEFRIFREVFVQIIMEKNAAIISQAAERRERLRVELAGIGRAKQAMRGYNRKSGRSWNGMEKTA